jgi:ribosomal protein S18 acetylase RimI-like enzyme
MPTLDPYRPSDRGAVLAVFDANTPRFFDAHERAEFEEFLDQPDGDFRVLRDEEGKTIGCGGVRVSDDGEASLMWGMIAPPYQGCGFGWWMALERLSWIAATLKANRVVLDTSTETAAFYTKLGFRTVSVWRDYYGPGLDRHDLVMDVDDAFRKRFFGSPTPPEPRSTRA